MFRYSNSNSAFISLLATIILIAVPSTGSAQSGAKGNVRAVFEGLRTQYTYAMVASYQSNDLTWFNTYVRNNFPFRESFHSIDDVRNAIESDATDAGLDPAVFLLQETKVIGVNEAAHKYLARKYNLPDTKWSELTLGEVKFYTLIALYFMIQEYGGNIDAEETDHRTHPIRKIWAELADHDSIRELLNNSSHLESYYAYFGLAPFKTASRIAMQSPETQGKDPKQIANFVSSTIPRDEHRVNLILAPGDGDQGNVPGNTDYLYVPPAAGPDTIQGQAPGTFDNTTATNAHAQPHMRPSRSAPSARGLPSNMTRSDAPPPRSSANDANYNARPVASANNQSTTMAAPSSAVGGSVVYSNAFALRDVPANDQENPIYHEAPLGGRTNQYQAATLIPKVAFTAEEQMRENNLYTPNPTNRVVDAVADNASSVPLAELGPHIENAIRPSLFQRFINALKSGCCIRLDPEDQDEENDDE